MIKTEETKYEVYTTKKFRQQFKKILKQDNDVNELIFVVKKLANKEVLDSKYKDHNLVNNKYFNNCRECHIEPAWLLVYKYIEDKLILYLLQIGSHSDLFN